MSLFVIESHHQLFTESRIQILYHSKSSSICSVYLKTTGGVLYKKVVLRNFAKFTRKQLCQSLYFDKDAGLRYLFSRTRLGDCF